MRIENIAKDINYTDTQSFFNRRSDKYNEDAPYTVTMYQDHNPELVKQRNRQEVAKLKPLLKLNKSSKVLDIACGIGRWSDAITESINEYCGIDFCENFIKIAKERSSNMNNRFFYCSSSTDFLDCLKNNNKDSFNCILLIGSLMYLNDTDLMVTLKQISDICQNNTIICIREPVGIKKRLTLIEHFSEELNDKYNAIYRTREELLYLFKNPLLKKGFSVTSQGFLFENDELNNRIETAQYYFILERNAEYRSDSNTYNFE